MFPEFPFFELVTRDVIHKVVQDLKGYTSQMNFGEENKKNKLFCQHVLFTLLSKTSVIHVKNTRYWARTVLLSDE